MGSNPQLIMSWKDDADDAAEQEYDTPAFGLGSLSTGDTLTLGFDAEPEDFESEFGDGYRFEVTVIDTDVPLGDEEVESGEAALLTSSSPFLVALREAVGDTDLPGVTATIERTGEGYDTSYDVSMET